MPAPKYYKSVTNDYKTVTKDSEILQSDYNFKKAIYILFFFLYTE